MSNQAPITYEDAIAQGFEEITEQEFRAAIRKRTLPGNMEIQRVPDGFHPCLGLSDGTRCQDEFESFGQTYVGICKNHLCKYLRR